MAPEQLEHPQDIDQRADIYSLGVVFYEMLTSELPIGRFAPPSEKSTVDPRVDEIVLQTLEKERERRQRSAGEVKTQVETIATGPQQRPDSLGAAALFATPTYAATTTPSTTREWSALAIWSAVLTGFSLFLDLLSKQIYSLLSGEQLHLMVIIANVFLGCAGSIIGALAIWELPPGGRRRGLSVALFGAFCPMLLTLSSAIYWPWFFWKSTAIRQAASTAFGPLTFDSGMRILWLAVGTWILVRVWPWIANAYALSTPALHVSGRFETGPHDKRAISKWLVASAWVFIAVAILDLQNMLAGLALGIGNLIAGLALLTLTPRWRTAAIVTLWTACVIWVFRMVGSLIAPDYAELNLSGFNIRFSEHPFGFLLTALAGLSLIAWPYYVLTSNRGKATFGLIRGA